MESANVHSILHLGVHDGPGVRFVLFLQGCNLACKYCHNIDATLNVENKIISIDDILLEYKKYQAFYLDGGITVSGGEPLLQIDFIIKLFTRLKKDQINTAIDTSASVFEESKLLRLIEVTDLFIVDIKHFNQQDYYQLTKGNFQTLLQFLKFLDIHNKKTLIRVVVVPTINDSLEDILQLKNILKEYSNIIRVEFKPYKLNGRQKWLKLGMEYPLNVPEAGEEDIRRVSNYFYSTSLRK